MDAARTPVIISVGQSIEREEATTATELAARAAREALASVPKARDRIQRLSVVAISFSPGGVAPASDVARRLGIAPEICEVSTPGGNAPQWLVNRAAADIASGSLSSSLIVGAEATRSLRSARPDVDVLFGSAAGDEEAGEPDPVVGTSLSGIFCDAEDAIGLSLPAEIYPLFESALAHAEGRSPQAQREYLGRALERFTRVAASNPYAWFPRALSAGEISEVTPENRLTAEPYTKRMNSFPNVDLGSAILLTSLEFAREVAAEEGCVFVWAGASNKELAPSLRPDLGDSPAIRAASGAVFEAAGVDVDDVGALDLYSCFPSAVEVSARAIGVGMEDPRGVTLTGGMPYFGGPGNNYSSHGICSLVARLRESGGLGYVAANGGYLSKHSVGLYGATPPPAGFQAPDTSAAQRRLEADALPLAVGESGPATVDAGTVVYDREGAVASAPIVARFDDGRRVAAQAAPELRAELAGRSLVGCRVRVAGEPPVYEL